MSSYLLAIAIGPVQDFIAAARRTSDLWFGSQVLSQLSKAAAIALAGEGGGLIFPCMRGALLASRDITVANKLLVEVAGDPQRLAAVAEEAVRACWHSCAERALDQVSGVVVEDIWHDQVDDVIEFYAAWTPVDGDYAAAREQVERLLAGRKALRDFRPARGRVGVPKSSLDGARESVLKRVDGSGLGSRLGRVVRRGECLDAVGVIKRIGGEAQDFPSVSSVAADPWLRACAGNAEARRHLESIQRQCAQLPEGWCLRQAAYPDFPYDAELLFLPRLPTIARELKELRPDSAARIDTVFGEIARLLRAIKQLGLGEPSPYLALLEADGDAIGAAMAGLRTADAHREFSVQLSQFAAAAKCRLTQHRGYTVYAGGDDLLAFVPLDICLQAARAVREGFSETVRLPGTGATLSVGVAIGHCLEPMEDLLAMVRQALQDAKRPNRNGLAVRYQARSGGDAVTAMGQWTAAGLADRLERWTVLIRERGLSARTAFDLKALAAEYRRLGGPGDDGAKQVAFADALLKDAARLLKRKRDRAGALSGEVVGELLGGVMSPGCLQRVADELILARLVSAGQPSTGKGTGGGGGLER